MADDHHYQPHDHYMASGHVFYPAGAGGEITQLLSESSARTLRLGADRGVGVSAFQAKLGMGNGRLDRRLWVDLLLIVRHRAFNLWTYAARRRTLGIGCRL